MNKASILSNVSAVFNEQLVKVIMGIVLIALSSQIIIPLEPVPITLQTVAIIFIGLTYSRKAATQSVIAYLTLGFIGVPVFSKLGSGPLYFMGPTAGYLLGFVVAVYVMSLIRSKLQVNNFFGSVLTSVSGLACIYSLGVAWLSVSLGLEKAIEIGFLPFIISGTVKVILLSLLLNQFKKK